MELEIPIDKVEVDPIFRMPSDKDFMIPASLAEQLDDGQTIHKYLSKQTDIDKLMV